MMKNWICLLMFVAIVGGSATPFAKHDDDVVVLKNGDRVTGEIKGMQRGELKIKADYMAEAVRLDWTTVQGLESKSSFIISLVDGTLVTNVMRLLPTNSDEVPNFVIGSSHDAVRVYHSDV